MRSIDGRQDLLSQPKVRLESFWAISLVLLAAWAGGLLVFHIGSVVIHMLLVLAVMFYVGHLVKDTSTT
jgi:Family of unknown function (DUF5670)